MSTTTTTNTANLPRYFVPMYQLIVTLQSLPSTGNSSTGKIGYTAAEIQVQHNLLYPGNTFTYEETLFYLQYGAKKGIFALGGCLTGANATYECGVTLIPGVNDTSLQLYYVNPSMAEVNTANIIYTQIDQPPPDPTQPRLGYLPPGYCYSGGKNVNYYAGATRSSNPTLPPGTGNIVNQGCTGGFGINTSGLTCAQFATNLIL